MNEEVFHTASWTADSFEQSRIPFIYILSIASILSISFSTISKRPRPIPSSKRGDDYEVPSSKKARRPRSKRPDQDFSDNDENFLTNSKSSSSTILKIKPKLITTLNDSIQRKGNKLSSDFKPENIDCSCRRNDDTQEKFFIQCELCSRWLHGKCVGLTPRLAEKMNEFICEDCAILTQRAKERLYCICQTPYDDSKYAPFPFHSIL